MLLDHLERCFIRQKSKKFIVIINLKLEGIFKIM